MKAKIWSDAFAKNPFSCEREREAAKFQKRKRVFDAIPMIGKAIVGEKQFDAIHSLAQ